MNGLRCEPLGDQAVLAYGADESVALAFAAAVRAARFAWADDVVQAYTSIAIFYDGRRIDFSRAAAELQALRFAEEADRPPGRQYDVPCCYEMSLDLDRVARHTGLSEEQIIALHAGAIYTVYAIGFCPGFPYLGYLPPELEGVPRLETPRLNVEAGSIGLTGRQTGVYTETRPGGWNIVGRTPLELVNVADGYFPLATGDRVRFRRIDERTFNELRGERLS